MIKKLKIVLQNAFVDIVCDQSVSIFLFSSATFRNVIEFRNVNKWFGALQVLKNVNLKVAGGEVVVVCGPSGSGKSTLIRCINRLEPFQSGEIIVDGLSLADANLNASKLRANVGMVFQSFNLYPHMTVLRNITLAPVKVKNLSENDAEKIARQLLARVGIPDRRRLSSESVGGQQQRVAIARALAMTQKLCSLMSQLGAEPGNDQ